MKYSGIHLETAHPEDGLHAPGVAIERGKRVRTIRAPGGYIPHTTEYYNSLKIYTLENRPDRNQAELGRTGPNQAELGRTGPHRAEPCQAWPSATACFYGLEMYFRWLLCVFKD